MAEEPDYVQDPNHKVEIPEPTPEPDVWTPDGRFDTLKASQIAEQTKDWPDEQRGAFLARLRAAEVRATVKTKYAHPAEIAKACDQRFRITPAVALISTAIERVLRSPKKLNVLITMPPQEGKSTTAAVWTPIRALQLKPRPIILATYAAALAEKHSREMRRIISTHGAGVTDTLTGLPVEDKLGLRLAQGANKVSNWSIDGGAGGVVAAGIGSAITGFQADLMIIDDPFKNMMEADSAAHRVNVDDWFSNVALTRLSPSASVILIQTRWHPEDLAGKIIEGERLLDQDERTWRHINIPAIAEEGIEDALRREPGEPMVSARDTPEAKRNFSMTRKQVGERTWYALYQGSPRNPAGGIFQRAWFEPRLEGVPAWPVVSVVGIDPADSGEGDEAGVIAGMMLQDGRVALTHDRSGQYTSDQWAVVGVTLALEIGARLIAVEGYTAAKTYVKVVRQAYRAFHEEAVAKRKRGESLTPLEQRALPDIPPFTVVDWRGPNKADAVARSAGLSQAFETRRALTVEFALRVFEEQAADWQAGQHQPDRVAAGVIVYEKLIELGGQRMNVAGPRPKGGGPKQPPAWMTRKIGGGPSRAAG